jgi:putative transposase
MEKASFPMTFLCEQLGVSRSGFYAWKHRPVSDRAKNDLALLDQIRKVFDQHKGRYGSTRVHNELKTAGKKVGRNRVARLMKENGIVARRRKRRVKTTDSNHGRPVAENLLGRQFTATEPNQKWLTDVTYVATLAGWLYLAVILDLFSRRVVGWAMSHSKDRHLARAALSMAVANRRPPKGLLHHSDQGSDYASGDYQDDLQRHGMICSMSRRGNCWDNAPMESFFGTMKTELPELETPQSSLRTQATIFEYMESYYNRQRSHSTLGYKSPVAYEQEFMQHSASLAA